MAVAYERMHIFPFGAKQTTEGLYCDPSAPFLYPGEQLTIRFARRGGGQAVQKVTARVLYDLAQSQMISGLEIHYKGQWKVSTVVVAFMKVVELSKDERELADQFVVRYGELEAVDAVLEFGTSEEARSRMVEYLEERAGDT